LRFVEAGARIGHVPRFLAGFRVHEEQKTTTQHELGLEECDRLRERTLGRPVPHAEAMRLVEPYLRRHVPRHLLHRAAARLPLPRLAVDASPRYH
jgi:hypothetical protein